MLGMTQHAFAQLGGEDGRAMQIFYENCDRFPTTKYFGQNPRARKDGAVANRWQKVASIAEASAACRQFITDNELGGGNWSGGDVQDASGKVVARISYNGRAWLPGDL